MVRRLVNGCYNGHLPDLHRAGGIPLVIVKVVTSEPGLYGIGCATYTQRWITVANAVDRCLKPLLVGKDVSRIEDIWQMSMVSAYWRNGPVAQQRDLRRG